MTVLADLNIYEKEKICHRNLSFSQFGLGILMRAAEFKERAKEKSALSLTNATGITRAN